MTERSADDPSSAEKPDAFGVRLPGTLRFGLRLQLLALFTLAFTVVLAGVFIWAFQFMTQRTAEVLRGDLNDTLHGVVKSISGDDLASLYADGAPNAAGLSDDPRWQRAMARLVDMHDIEPRSWGSIVVRGDEPTTRRSNTRAAAPEFISLVELGPPDVHVARFLESRHLGPLALQAWEQISERPALVEVPDTHEGHLGPAMTSIAPIKDGHGRTVALLLVDFEARDIRAVTQRIKSSLIVAAGITYAIVVVLVYIAAGVFTRPIRDLTRYAESLDQATLGMGLELEKRPDELGALARAYNSMSQRLAKAFGDLEGAKADLEKRVIERTAELSEEREKSDRLLRNVLPEEIAERLKSDPKVIAEGFDSVTVLFADIVGFTTLSAKSTPIAVVRLLNEIFSAFDTLADKFGLEKIKTIGDAYMVVGGLPTPRPDHAVAMADMAIEMQLVMRALDAEYPGLSIRIGMNSGPVVAGVIGSKKFTYDLWGDTVNVASRMESHGDPGRIQVSGALARVLEPSFVLERRGIIQVKGRGELETFWLIGRRTGSPPLAASSSGQT